MRIAQVSTGHAKCGISEYSRYLSKALIGLGHEVMVCSEKSEENEPYNVPYQDCWLRTNQDSYMEMVKFLDDWKPDICHWQYEYALHITSGPVFELSNPRPHFMTWHNVVNDSKSVWYGQLSDRSIVHNYPCAEALGALGIGGAIIPHGTRKNEITSKDEAKKKLGIDLDRKVVATFGFTDVRKGFHILTSSWSRLKKYCPEALYLCIGGRHPKSPGLHGYYRLFEDQINRYPDDFMSTGYLEDDGRIDMALSAADAVVFPHLGGDGILSASGSVRRVIDHAPLLVVQDIRFYSEFTPDMCIRIPNNFPYIPFGKWLGRHLENSEDEEHMALRNKLKEYAAQTYWSKVAEMHVEKYQDYLNLRKDLR